MGDRGNIVVRQESDTNKGDVWFYTHWSGYRLKSVVHEALAKKWRWDDPSYLARIVFDCLTGGKVGETGYGISTSISDNQYPIVVVDVPKKCVYEVDEDSLEDGRLPAIPIGKPLGSFEELANKPLEQEPA